MSVFDTDNPELKGLVGHLNDFYDKTRTGKSTGFDYQKATNALREHYDNGLIPQEAKNEIAQKLKFYAQNAGRSLSNAGPDVIHAIESNGGMAKKLASNSGGFAHLMPMLGLGAAAFGAKGIYDKFKSGDKTGAALDAAGMVDPTGIAGAIGDMKKRMEDPEYAKEQTKNDRINALPIGMAEGQQAIDDTTEENSDDKKKPLMARLFGY